MVYNNPLIQEAANQPPIISWYNGRTSFEKQFTIESYNILLHWYSLIEQDIIKIGKCLKDSKFINEINEKGKKFFNSFNTKNGENGVTVAESKRNETGQKPEVKDSHQGESFENLIQNPFKVFFEMNYEDEVKEMVKKVPNVAEKQKELENFYNLNRTYSGCNNLKYNPFMINGDLMEPYNKKLIYEYRLALAEQFKPDKDPFHSGDYIYEQ